MEACGSRPSNLPFRPFLFLEFEPRTTHCTPSSSYTDSPSIHPQTNTKKPRYFEVEVTF